MSTGRSGWRDRPKADRWSLYRRPRATAMTEAPRILHVITGLAPGGAETMLVRLLEELGDDRRGHSVISLRERWSLVDRLEELGVPVQALGMGGKPTPTEIVSLARALRSSQADVIQTWMLHSNVLAGVLARAGMPPGPGRVGGSPQRGRSLDAGHEDGDAAALRGRLLLVRSLTHRGLLFQLRGGYGPAAIPAPRDSHHPQRL